MKRFWSCLLAILLMMTQLAACGERKDNGKVRVVCTTFAQYDWTRELTRGCEDIELTLLVGAGKEIHSYDPSAADLIDMTNADLLIYGGGISEQWVGELVRKNGMKNALCLIERPSITLLHGDRHDHTHGGACGDADEHIWLSPRNAVALCREIAARLCALEGADETRIRENLAAYEQELAALDAAYGALASSAETPMLVLADRHPFRYLFEEYGIECHAAFPGCSSESNASFDTVISLAKTVDANGLRGVAMVDGSDGRLAETVLANTASGGKIYILDSLQLVKEPENTTYLGVMQRNLQVLEEMIGGAGVSGQKP